MTLSDKEWETLNAYVDGELSSSEKRAFETILGTNPELLEEKKRLLSLKAGLQNLKPKIDPLDYDIKTAPSSSTFRKNLVAAVLLAVILGMGAYLVTFNYSGNARTPLSLHAELSAKTYVLQSGSPHLTISSGDYRALSIPDLTPSALILADVITADLGVSEAIAMHYRGQRGCRLTFIAVKGGLKRNSLMSPKNTILKEKWSLRGTDFYLFANGMDKKRFRAIAAYAKRQQDVLRIAMAETYKSALPCA